jgi:hypothetical protein
MEELKDNIHREIASIPAEPALQGNSEPLVPVQGIHM